MRSQHDATSASAMGFRVAADVGVRILDELKVCYSLVTSGEVLVRALPMEACEGTIVSTEESVPGLTSLRTLKQACYLPCQGRGQAKVAVQGQDLRDTLRADSRRLGWLVVCSKGKDQARLCFSLPPWSLARSSCLFGVGSHTNTIMHKQDGPPSYAYIPCFPSPTARRRNLCDQVTHITQAPAR